MPERVDANQGQEAAVMAADTARLQAMVAGDAAALERLFHADLDFTHSSGAKDTKASYLQKIRDGSAYVLAERLDGTAQVRGDTAWITGGSRLGIERPGVARRDLNLRFVSVWLREAGNWQLVAYVSTPVPK